MNPTRKHADAARDERLTALLKLPHDALLKPPEAALVLGLAGPGTLSQWRHHHRYALKWILIGQCVRYRLGDVLAFLASRTIDGLSGPPAGMKVHGGGPGRGHTGPMPQNQQKRARR